MIELTQHDQRILVNPDNAIYIMPASATHVHITYNADCHIMVDATMAVARNKFKGFLLIDNKLPALINPKKIDYILESDDKKCLIFLNGIDIPFTSDETYTKFKKKVKN